MMDKTFTVIGKMCVVVIGVAIAATCLVSSSTVHDSAHPILSNIAEGCCFIVACIIALGCTLLANKQ
jgi:hypothetical protein